MHTAVVVANIEELTQKAEYLNTSMVINTV